MSGVNEFASVIDGSGVRVAVVVSRFNRQVTDQLKRGALAALLRHGVAESSIDVFEVPGAWELPQAVGPLVGSGGYDAVVALGCVIRGETPHFEFVAGEAARGLAEAASRGRVPVAFGVLTTDDAPQAERRADPDGMDKGGEAALSALEMVALLRRIGEPGA